MRLAGRAAQNVVLDKQLARSVKLLAGAAAAAPPTPAGGQSPLGDVSPGPGLTQEKAAAGVGAGQPPLAGGLAAAAARKVVCRHTARRPRPCALPKTLLALRSVGALGAERYRRIHFG